jgi:hypothetical protein
MVFIALLSLSFLVRFAFGFNVPRIAVLLRGHVRDADATETSRKFVDALMNSYSADLFIHTWASRNVKAGNGWRRERTEMTSNLSNTITEKTLTSYFNRPIKQIKIDDEEAATIYGSSTGYVGLTRMHRKGWKRMWRGIYDGLAMVNRSGVMYRAVVCARIDVVQSYTLLSYQLKDILDMTKGAVQSVLNGTKQVATLYDDDKSSFNPQGKCVDNVFSGTQDALLRLVGLLHYRLDDIEFLLGREMFQEKLFLRLIILYRSYLFQPSLNALINSTSVELRE